MGVDTSFALSLQAWISDASICSNSSMSAVSMSPFQIPTACNAYPRNIPGKTFGPNWCNLDWSLAETGWYSTIAPNGITVPLNGIPNRHSYGLFPKEKYREYFADSSNIPWNPPTIHCPDLIATKLQMSLFHSAHCSLSNPMCFRSVWRWRTMIPVLFFRGFFQIPRNCQCNDFWFPRRLQELH